MKDIHYRYARSQKIFIHFFSYGIMPLLIIEIWPKLSILLKQFSSATPLNRFTKLYVTLKLKWRYCVFVHIVRNSYLI